MATYGQPPGFLDDILRCGVYGSFAMAYGIMNCKNNHLVVKASVDQARWNAIEFLVVTALQQLFVEQLLLASTMHFLLASPAT
jgi:hypothetical protein